MESCWWGDGGEHTGEASPGFSEGRNEGSNYSSSSVMTIVKRIAFSLFKNTPSLGRWRPHDLISWVIKCSSELLSWMAAGDRTACAVSPEKERRGPQMSWGFSRCLSNEKFRGLFLYFLQTTCSMVLSILGTSVWKKKPMGITLNEDVIFVTIFWKGTGIKITLLPTYCLCSIIMVSAFPGWAHVMKKGRSLTKSI